MRSNSSTSSSTAAGAPSNCRRSCTVAAASAAHPSTSRNTRSRATGLIRSRASPPDAGAGTSLPAAGFGGCPMWTAFPFGDRNPAWYFPTLNASLCHGASLSRAACTTFPTCSSWCWSLRGVPANSRMAEATLDWENGPPCWRCAKWPRATSASRFSRNPTVRRRNSCRAEFMGELRAPRSAGGLKPCRLSHGCHVFPRSLLPYGRRSSASAGSSRNSRLPAAREVELVGSLRFRVQGAGASAGAPANRITHPSRWPTCSRTCTSMRRR